MTIEASKLIHLPIAAEDAMAKIGIITQIVIDPENGRILGFLVKTGFFGPPMALSIIDIHFWDKDGIVTKKEENLVPVTEIIRIQKVVDRKINLINMPAKTETGKSLGIVEDFLIDTETASITKYYLRDILNRTRIIAADKVVKIDKEIIFVDDKEKLGNIIPEIQIA